MQICRQMIEVGAEDSTRANKSKWRIWLIGVTIKDAMSEQCLSDV